MQVQMQTLFDRNYYIHYQKEKENLAIACFNTYPRKREIRHFPIIVVQ